MRSELVDDVRFCAFTALGLVSRCVHPSEYDDLDEGATAARAALDELQELLPVPNHTVDHEVREGCALLRESVDLIVQQTGRAPGRRRNRRRVRTLHARGAEHIARALAELRRRRTLRPVPAQPSSEPSQPHDLETPAHG